MKLQPHRMMSEEQVKEVSDSGLVSIQSHTLNHHFLDWRSEEGMRLELYQSKLDLIRVTGKEPFVLCYPAGHENEHVREVAYDEYNYNFGLKMTGDVFVTGEADPMLIYRFYYPRGGGIEKFVELLETKPASEMETAP